MQLIAKAKMLRKHCKSFVAIPAADKRQQNGYHAAGTNSQPVTRQTSQAESAIKQFILEHDDVFIVKADGVKSFTPNGSDLKLEERVDKVLREALSARITKLNVRIFTYDKRQVLAIGISLDQRAAYDNLIRGPLANDPVPAKAFRQLWGDLSECRRFPDLNTCEAVHFPAKNLAEKRNIIAVVVEHMMQHHFKIPSHFVRSLSCQVNSFLKPRNLPAEEYGTGEEALNSIIVSLEELVKKVRQIKKLPLSVSSLQGISPAFRGADVWPQVPVKEDSETPGIRAVTPHEVVMYFEVSGKWPEDLDALRAVKFQLIIEFCKSFETELKLPCKPSASYFDVMHDGYAFRIIPYVKKELVLMRQIKCDTGVLLKGIRAFEETQKMHTRCELIPKLTGALNGINTRFMAYNAACRLAKRWVSSQYLLPYINELIIELLTAFVFLSSDPAPSTPIAGFVRFLHLLSSHPFHKKPLLVDFNRTFTANQISKIESYYSSLNSKPRFFIVTPYDHKFGMFSATEGSINSTGILDLLVSCADKCLQTLLKILSDPESKSISPIFKHPIENAHLLIYLKKKHIAVRRLTSSAGESVEGPLIGVDPVQDYLKNLRKIYDDFAVFLNDCFGDLTVYVFFKSICFKSDAKSVLEDGCLSLEPFFSGLGSKATVNIEALIESFKHLGDGVVHKIESKPANWPVV